MGVGKTQWMAAMAFASGAIVLGVGLLLVPRYGLMGAGWAQILAIVLSRPIIHARLWRSSLHEVVSAKVFFSCLYGPAVTGIMLTLLLCSVREDIAWVPGWFELGVGMLACAGIFLGAIVITDIFLPGSRQRHADLHQLLMLVLTRSQRFLLWSRAALKIERA
jgi:hypothetical protein